MGLEEHSGDPEMSRMMEARRLPNGAGDCLPAQTEILVTSRSMAAVNFTMTPAESVRAVVVRPVKEVL